MQLLSTTFLLKNLTFLLMWFAVLWAIVPHRTQRRVYRLIARWQSDPRLDPSLSFNAQTVEWIDELLEPIQQHRDQTDALDLGARRKAPRRDVGAVGGMSQCMPRRVRRGESRTARARGWD